jgi:diadenosine tetraphosphate (Ap4A) HIT family hydrolase
LFCKMVAGEIKPDVVFEDDRILAMHQIPLPKNMYVGSITKIKATKKAHSIFLTGLFMAYRV